MHIAETEHNKRILQQFTKQAEPFAAAPAHSTEESLRVLLDATAVASADCVLDLACGPGIVSCAFAARAKNVTGVDMVPAMLEQAAKLEREKNLKNVEWKLGNAGRLDFPDNSFSLVVTRYSFHHMLDPLGVLTEMARVCRPGRRIAVADVTPDADKTTAYDALERLRDESHAHALSLAELKTLGQHLGLRPFKEAFFRLDTGVEELLGASFPEPGKADEFRRAVRDDVGVDRLSIQAYELGGELRFGFPISVMVWTKPDE